MHNNMKKIIRLLLTISIFSLASCNFASLTPKDKDKNDFDYSQINYETTPGYNKSDLEGAPWINSNILGMVERVEQPSLKDDFYTSVNYDDFIEGNYGPFDVSGSITHDNLNDIYSGTVNYPNKAFIRRMKNLTSSGAPDRLKTYFDNFNINTFVSSKELFMGECSIFSFYCEDGQDSYSVHFNDGYSNNLYGYQTLAYYGMYGYTSFVDAATYISEYIYSTIGYDSSVATYLACQGIDGVMNIVYPQNPARNTINYVSDIPIEEFQNALLDAGLTLQDKISIDPNAYGSLNHFYSMYRNSSEELEMGCKAIMSFERRHLIGLDNYRGLSPYITNLAFISDEIDLSQVQEEAARNQLTNLLLPRLIDKAFIYVASSEETVTTVSGLITDIIAEYKLMVDDASWLSKEARSKIKKKLDYMGHTACHSSKVENYLSIDETDLYSKDAYDLYCDYQDMLINQRCIKNYEYNATITSYARPYVVNAFYNPYSNEFVIADGLLPGGFLGDSIEVNYARAGMVIGHEISHAFDSTGSYFDENGQYHQNGCWPSKDMVEFNSKVKKLANFYDKIRLDKVNYAHGKQIEGEAIADMGGLGVILRLAKKVNNFDYDKFFRSYASLWKEELGSWEYENMLRDSHPFAYLRVNVTVAQFEEFYQTYKITSSDRMFISKSDRIAIW